MPKIPENYTDWTAPWGEGEFDEDKAKRLVYNALLGQQKAKDATAALRTENEELKTSVTTLEGKVGDKGKDDSAKDVELATLRAENSKLKADGRPEDKSLIQRLEVAIDHKLTKRDARRLVGDNEDELVEDAKDFAKRLGISEDDDEHDDDDKGSKPPSRQPVPASQLGNGRQRQGGQPQLVSAAELVKQGTTAIEGIPALTR